MFNAGRYWERVREGELVIVELYSGEPDPDKGQPPGTRTVTYAFRESKAGPDLAHAHAFIQPGWVIGASGKPDPKRIWKDGILYLLKKGGSHQ